MRSVQILIILTWAGLAHAQQDRVVLNADVKAKKGLYPIAVAPPVDSDPTLTKLVVDVQTFDLNVSSWFSVLDPRSFLADHKKEGMTIEPQRWKDVGAYGVIKTKAVSSGANVILQFKLYELEKGAGPVLEREYKGSIAEARKLVHRWCNDVVRYYTGEDGFFGSRIVFVKNGRGSKSVLAMEFDGHAIGGVTKNDSINLLPAFSPKGAIAFTSYMRGNPDLYLTSGGRPQRVSTQQGMNTGASFSPDGSKIVLTLSKDGNPELYIISASNGSVVKRLTNNRYIDTSPAWSPDGREIAFVSNREGGPQIFVMNADGSNQRRVSTTGGFNQTPAWNPKKGMRQLAYTARDDASGRYDIITLDLASSKLVRVTQNQGNNEEPTFSPNGRVIAFASSRSGGTGIFLANADGTGEQRLVYKGSATSPDWGPNSP
jgi:TolB protein